MLLPKPEPTHEHISWHRQRSSSNCDAAGRRVPQSTCQSRSRTLWVSCRSFHAFLQGCTRVVGYLYCPRWLAMSPPVDVQINEYSHRAALLTTHLLLVCYADSNSQCRSCLCPCLLHLMQCVCHIICACASLPACYTSCRLAVCLSHYLCMCYSPYLAVSPSTTHRPHS